MGCARERSVGFAAGWRYFEQMMQPRQFKHLLHRCRGIGQTQRDGVRVPVLVRRLMERHEGAQTRAVHGLSLGQINFNRSKVVR